MHVCVHQVHAAPRRARREHQTPWNLERALQVLGTVCSSSGRVASALNHLPNPVDLKLGLVGLR